MRTHLRFLTTVLLSVLAAVTVQAPAFAATEKVRLDMQDCNGDVAAPIDEATWNAASVASTVGGVQTICAASFGPADAAEPASVRFTIVSGPGHFTDAAGTATFGPTVDVTQGATYNTAYITSTVAGTTTVRAAVGSVADEGTKVWSSGAARTIGVGTPSGSGSSAARVLTATVRDTFGNGVPGVTVTFATSGVGTLSSPAQVVTDSGGQATATVERNPGETGAQTLTATIAPAVTDCERLAGDPAGAPAGVCSVSTTIQWTASATQLWLAADPVHAVIGTTFSLFGRLVAGTDPVGGQTIRVQRRDPPGLFVVIGEAITDGDGRFVVTDRPTRNSAYRAVFTGGDQLLSSVSALAGVGVRVGIILNVSPARAPAGTAVTFTGAVIPGHPGRSVYLQQYSPSSGWRTITSTTLSSRSTYQFRVLKRTTGFLIFRTAFASDSDHVWNISISRRVDWS